MFVWQAPDWPRWRADAQAVQPALTAARLAQGRMLGMAQTLHLTERGALDAECWSNEAMATARIEGEELALESVRASAAALIRSTISAASTSALPGRWPQRLMPTWSSRWQPAAPARVISRIVRPIMNAPPQPVSASTSSGSSVA